MFPLMRSSPAGMSRTGSTGWCRPGGKTGSCSGQGPGQKKERAVIREEYSSQQGKGLLCKEKASL